MKLQTRWRRYGAGMAVFMVGYVAGLLVVGQIPPVPGVFLAGLVATLAVMIRRIQQQAPENEWLIPDRSLVRLICVAGGAMLGIVSRTAL